MRGNTSNRSPLLHHRPAVWVSFVLAALSIGQSSGRAAPLRSPTVPFIENRGQADPRMAFTARTAHGTVFITQAGEIVYALPGGGPVGAHGRAPRPLLGGGPVGAIHESPLQPIDPTAGLTLHETLVGGTVHGVQGQDQAVTKVNIFHGQDPAQWSHDLPTFGRVDFGEVYPGITMQLQAKQNNVEKVFVVAPGGNPDNIRLQVNVGAHGRAPLLDVDATGALVVTTDFGAVTFTEPVAYQEIVGQRRSVAVHYEVEGLEYGFSVGAYDRNYPLVIDPLLASTYLGGVEEDSGGVVAVGNDGSIYVAGRTVSVDFPSTSGAYDETHNNYYDIFVSKFDSQMTTLLASTYLGGNAQDKIHGLAIDPDGNVIVAGITKSPDFPTTAGAYDTTGSGHFAIFVSKFDPNLSSLLASTYAGGEASMEVAVMTLDPSGNVYVAGNTTSGFVTTPGCYDDTMEGPVDAYVAKLDNSLANLLSATYLGGEAGEQIYSIALDAAGDVIVTGYTNSTMFPTTLDAFQETDQPEQDAFVSKLDADLTTLLASTYLGGKYHERGTSLVTDANGNIYVVGRTDSFDFPVTPGAFDVVYEGPFASDAFISLLNPELSMLMASTYLGGDRSEYRLFAAIDPIGDVVVIGDTASTDFPILPGALQETMRGERDIFVSRLDAELTTLRASTYLGGSNADTLIDMYEGQTNVAALDSFGNVILTGLTLSLDFPVVSGGYQESTSGSRDAFVAKLDRSLLAFCVHNGDVTGDGQVSAGDAQLAFMIALGAYVAIAPQECAADCNGDAIVTAGDAQQIFQEVLGFGQCVDLLE